MRKPYFLLSLFICLVFASSSASATTINSYEIQKLANGQIIHKSVHEQIKKGIKASESRILIHAPKEKVWEILNKKENLPKFIHQIQEAKIIGGNQNSQKVKTSIKICKLLPTFDYILYFDQREKYKKMKFQKTGGCFKELFGYFEFIPYGDSTILGYKIYMDPGFYVPEFIGNNVKSNSKEMMLAIKKEAEK